MKIEELLKQAGITDEDAIAKVQAEMPKAFIPLDDFNKRMAKVQTANETLQAEYDTLKASADAAAKAAEESGKELPADVQDALTELEKVKQNYADLEGKFTASQNAIKQRDAQDALTAAFKAAGANPAALQLMVGAAIDRVEYDDDGKPANADALVDAAKADANTAALFGEAIDTSEKPAKATEANKATDDFLKGFGDTEKH